MWGRGVACALLLLAGGGAGAAGTAKAELPKGLAAAEAAQKLGNVVATAVVSQVVKQAPAAELASGDGDLNTAGACEADITAFCAGTEPGEGRLAGCLSNQGAADAAGGAGRQLAPECAAELRQFKVDRASNINKDLALAVACADDAAKFCNASATGEPGAVLTCLREVKAQLAPACSAEVLRTQLAAAEDFKLDAMLSAMCGADAERLCAAVPAGGGRVQACLREQRAQLGWDCQEELFRAEVENADDLRLNVVLFRKCARDRRRFCPDVAFGGARVKECLEDHKDEAGFGAECKAEFEGMMARRATDFRLDAQLRALCAADIDAVCGYERDSLDSVAGHDGRVVECLQDYKEELTSPACRQRVHGLTARAAADIRMDRPLADACAADTKALCAEVPPGEARVLRCLEEHSSALSYECRATLFDQEVRLAEDIDFQVPLKAACGAELARFCKAVTPGQARVIQCLVDHDEEVEYSGECRAEVKRFEIRAGQDYRLQFRLHRTCAPAIAALCGDVCSPFQGRPCGGTVLACLVAKRDAVAATFPACEPELFEYEKQITNDERVDVVLAAACAGDVTRFCADVPSGLGRVHECLRAHEAQLAPACAAEELALEEVEAGDVRLKPGFARDCAEEMAVYCAGVPPGKGRMYRCLTANTHLADFSAACQARVAEKAARAASIYTLDFGLRSACGPSADALCGAHRDAGHGKTPVLRCLAQALPALTNKPCQAELGRALRMALWQFRPGAALTDVCDADVAAQCSAQTSGAAAGSVGRCLARLVGNGSAVAPQCATLVTFAVPPDPRALDTELAEAALSARLQALTADAAKQLVAVQPGGQAQVTLTGWLALLSTAALVAAMAGAGTVLYRKAAGLDRPRVLVVKGGDV